ncbi:MAG TPA: sensor histidine kinase [Nitrospirota bacterium]|nr:sensor histidine kinase [Nitrospirota bacterium]
MMRKKIIHTHWLPVAVVLFGLLGAVLFAWTNHINEKQRVNYLLLDAIMDVQIKTSTFHLWFEQVLAGDRAVDIKEVWEDHERALRLVDAVMNGGQSDHGLIPKPLDDPGKLSRAEKIKTLLASLKTIGLVRMQQPAKAGIGSVLDHQFDDVFGKILVTAAGLELVVQDEQVRIQGQAGRLLIAIILVWTTIVIGAAMGLLSLERRRSISEQALRTAHDQLLHQAEELKKHREHLTDLVSLRTKELTSTNKNLIQKIAERRKAEDALRKSQKQLRHLSSMILTAQEEERRKISRELHDELGQSLTLVKFQLRSVERQLREDQGAVREECENTLKYMNTVIENVRRLSRDLCPPILQDMGLTRALKPLADNFRNSYGIRLVVDAEDVDHLFPKNAQTNIYRIVQEALTNIVKHSGAESARVVVRRGRGSVAIFIEDDGKGFRRAEAASHDSQPRGLGLVSMEERVGMLGGSLSIWSEQGRGTRVSFSIPVDRTGPADGEEALNEEVIGRGNDARFA